MPYQENRRWFCKYCKYYSSDKLAEVQQHEEQHRRVPELFSKWDKLLGKHDDFF